MSQSNVIIHEKKNEPWKVTVVDTGFNTMTGGRIKRIEKYIIGECFFLTYGDGVCDVNISDLLRYHRKSKKKATLTAVKVDQRFGVLDIVDGSVRAFRGKSKCTLNRLVHDIWFWNHRYLII